MSRKGIVKLVVAVAAMALMLESCNILIDPFYRFDIVSVPTINAQRSMFAYQGRMAKAESICRTRPEQVVLSGSKAEIAIDPHSPLLGSYRTYNMGESGMPLSEMLPTLRFIARNAPLKRVLVGLDFMDFNQLRENVVYQNEVVDFDGERIAGSCRDAFIHDADWLIGWRALKYSYATMLDQRDLATGQDNALLDGLAAIPDLIGNHNTEVLYWSQSDDQQIKDDNNRHWAINFDADGFRNHFDGTFMPGGGGFAAYGQEQYYVEKIWRPAPRHDYEFGDTWRTFDAILRFAKANHIELRLYTEPLHARMLLAINDAGLQPQFEQWKHGIANAAHAYGLPLWDFEAFNTVTENQDYWYEPSHYSKRAGDMILDRILHDAPTDGFGARLEPEIMDAYLADQVQRMDDYMARAPDTAAAVATAVRDSIAKTPTEAGRTHDYAGNH